MLITGLKPGVNERSSLTFRQSQLIRWLSAKFEPGSLANNQPVADIDHGLNLQSVRVQFIA